MKRPFFIVAFLLFSGQLSTQSFAQNDRSISSAEKGEIIDSIIGFLAETYVYEEVAAEMNSLVISNSLSGAYDHITDLDRFIEVLNEDLISVCRDRHFRILPFIDTRATDTTQENEEQLIEMMRLKNFGFKKIEILPGNIGYLKLDEFADARYAGETAVAAMNFLSNCDALIIDLRENGGGYASMIQLLASYFFEEPQHINDFHFRIGDVYEQSWTFSYVPGDKMTKTPIFILTSSYTFSAAEEFIYDLQKLERATVVGDTTGGGAHPITGKAWDNLGITIVCPYARACNPVSKDNWEGVGIVPDFPVESQNSLERAQLLAYNQMLEDVEDPNRESEIKWYIEYGEGLLNPVLLSDEELEKYTGIYEPREIYMENGSLYYLRQGRSPYIMTYIGDDTFIMKDLITLKLKFQKDESGSFSTLIAIYQSGMVETNIRSFR